MNIEKTIRKQVMKGNSAEIRKLLLVDSQIELLKTLSTWPVFTASNLSDETGESIQLVSAKLKKLADSGYLVRDARNAESGGIEYTYYFNANNT